MVGSKDRNHDLRFSCNLVQIAMSLNARYGVVAQGLIGPRWIAQVLCSGCQKEPIDRSAETHRWSKPPSGTPRNQFKLAGAISRLLACQKKENTPKGFLRRFPNAADAKPMALPPARLRADTGAVAA